MLHIVTIKWKPGAPVEEIMKNLRTLKEKVPGHVLSVTVGETFMTERAKGFTHSMVVRLPSREDLNIYATHPGHVEVATKWVKPYAEDVLVMDIDELPGLIGSFAIECLWHNCVCTLHVQRSTSS